MSMDLDSLTADLIEDESIRLVVYDDATGLPLHPGMMIKGHPTIGVGRALDTHGISRDEAMMLLHNDMVGTTDQLHENLPWLARLDDVRQRVIAEMAFQLGMAGLLGFHAMLTALEREEYASAAQQMLQSKWAGQVPNRAKRLAERVRTGLA